MPNLAPDGPLDKDKKGLLSPIGDPLGQALDKSLKPTVGRLTGGIGRPNGEALLAVHDQARKEIGGEKSDDEGETNKEDTRGEKDKIGGKEQTAQNPLGL